MKKLFLFVTILIPVTIFAQKSTTQLTVGSGMEFWEKNKSGMGYYINFDIKHYLSNKIYLTGLLSFAECKNNIPATSTYYSNKLVNVSQELEGNEKRMGGGIGVDFLRLQNKHIFYTQLTGGLSTTYRAILNTQIDNNATPHKFEEFNKNETGMFGMLSLGYDFLITPYLSVGAIGSYKTSIGGSEFGTMNFGLRVGYIFK